MWLQTLVALFQTIVGGAENSSCCAARYAAVMKINEDSAVSLRQSPGSLKGQINVTPGETKTSPWSLLFVSTMEQRGRTMAFQLLKN